MRTDVRTQKIRHEVAVQRFASPLRDAAPRDLEDFWQSSHKYDRAVNAHWVDGGPCNLSGRATCLAVDPKNPDLLYAGSAAGGLWRSEDGGGNWTGCWPNSLSQNIGAVAIAPVDADGVARIVCATGEGNLATASYPGGGIYVSDDGGFTWRSFIWIPTKRRMSSQDRDSMPRRVSSISFSAKNPKTGERQIAFGSISNDEDLPGGLYLSTKAGDLQFVKWWSARPYNCYSAVFHPTEPDTLYAAIEAGGATNGVWRTTDGGTAWERLAGGLPAGESCGRISLAISDSRPDHMFALISSRPSGSRLAGNKGQGVLGVYRSINGGLAWERYGGKEFDGQLQLAFNNTIAIHPEHPEIAVCGAQSLFLTDNGGDSWRSISEEHLAITPTRRNKRYVHPDHHAIVMTRGKKNAIYSANDGGIFKCEWNTPADIGESWEPACHGMNTIMFYAIDVSQANGRIYGGGSQDNGSLVAGVKEGVGLRRRGDLAFTQVLKGDGGYLVCDPDEEELVFASTFETQTAFHEPGRRWARGFFSGSWSDASPKVSEAEKDILGLTVLAIKPADKNGPRELFLGTNRLWRSTYRKPGKKSKREKWIWRTSEFSFFDGSAISAIEIASRDPSVMYVGTARGGIFRSEDGGRNWSEDLAGPEIPNRVITQIETHPKDAGIVVVTVASSGRPAAVLGGQAKPYSHVFLSDDFGQTWQDIDQGGLPNVVFNGLAFETHAPYRIFVAGDAGPWVRQSNGRWASIGCDMPSAVISDIIYHHKTRTLFAGTYGRGIWSMKVPREFEILAGEPGLDADALLPPIEGYLLDRAAPVPEPLTPADGSRFDKFPRVTTFTCSPVAGAIGYVFEAVSNGGFPQVAASPAPTAEMEMSGADGFTWKCWALLPRGCSFPSNSLKFRYLR